MYLNINSDAVVKFTRTLESLGKEVLPEVVRTVLNGAAYGVKKKTMPKEADRFAKRKPTFFKANSTVVPAVGLDLRTMKSEVGFVPKPGDRSHSVEDLEQQEHGGGIGNRAFIPLKGARVGGAWNRMVRKDTALANIGDDIVDSLDAKGANDKVKFVKSAIHAGKGKFVIGTTRKNGARMLMRIRSLKRVGGNTMVNSEAVYTVKAGRSVTTHTRFRRFMATASMTSARKMEADYVKVAERKIRSLTVKNI